MGRGRSLAVYDDGGTIIECLPPGIVVVVADLGQWLQPQCPCHILVDAVVVGGRVGARQLHTGPVQLSRFAVQTQPGKWSCLSGKTACLFGDSSEMVCDGSSQSTASRMAQNAEIAAFVHSHGVDWREHHLADVHKMVALAAAAHLPDGLVAQLFQNGDVAPLAPVEQRMVCPVREGAVESEGCVLCQCLDCMVMAFLQIVRLSIEDG